MFAPDRVITDMNDLELAMIGYQRDEIVGKKTWADLIIPEQNERFEQHWRDIKTKGKVKNIEYTLLAKDGRKIEVILNASSRFDDDGNLINTRGSVLDITERKRAREAIESIVAGTARETGEDYLRSLVRHLSSAMGCKYVFVGELEEQETDRIKTLSVWADGNFAENFVYDIAGTPCQNVVGKQLCFFPRDIQEKFPDDHLIKEMGVVSYVGTPLHDSSGRALGILVAMDDKPMRGEAFAESILKVFGMRAAAELERKEAEEILKLRERAIGEATNGIIISGYEGYENPVIYANPAFERITGYKLEEIKGLDCRFLQSKDRDQKELDEVRAAIADGRSCQTVVKNYRKDGSLFWNELSISPVRDEFGEVTHYVGIINDITDRKQAEDAIGRLAKFPDENPNPVLRTMSDGSIVYCNRAGEPLLKEWECDLGDKLTGKCLQCVTDAMKTNKLVWLEFDCGDQIYLLSFAPVSGLDYLNIYGFNITVRKRAELELKESEEKYRLLFETNPHPMWVYDLDNLSFLAVNDTAVRTYGHSREEFLNMTIKDIRPQEDIPALLKSLENLKGGVDFGGVWRHKKKDGTIFFVETIAHTITFEGRHAEIVLASDVTERKRVEDSLAAERNLLRTLIDNIPDSIYVKDAESRFVMCNMAAACFMGKSDTEQVIGKTDFDFYQKELAEEYLSDEHQVLDTGLAVVNKDEPRIGAQNKMVWVLTTKVPLKDRDGRVIGLIGISRNITDRKQAEDARDRLNRELALKNKELESILYVASHDLRSPLVNIQGFSHELRRSCDVVRDGLSGVKGKTGQAAFEEVDKKIPEALNFILTSAQKMDSLIAGLLRLSRLGRAAMKPEVLDMNKMMGDIAASMEFQLKDAGVNVQIDSLPACVGDASQINQVFSNLLDNSIKYLDKARPGIIHIYGEIEGDRTIYCVEDNGVGVAHDYQDKIFEIFHRLVPGVKSGEGLGLTIVKRVLDRHGGNVWVESEQGKGSKFFVSLPNRLR
jgi:PAS domain S-box-containing protein